MRFAFFSHVHWPKHKSQDQVYQELVEQVQYAEELGFDSAWLAEHHFTRYGLAPSPLMLATYLAAKTSRIRLGTAVTILPFHDPVSLAEQVAMADVLSKGRVDLGVGGGEPHGFMWLSMNVPREEREERYIEVLDLLPKLWTTPNLSHHGKYRTFVDLTLVPQPVQQPHPPIYMGVTWNPKRLRDAIVRGHHVISGVILDLEEHLNIHADYDRIAAELGVDLRSGDCPMFLHTMVAESKQQAYEEARDSLLWMYQMNDFRRSLDSGSDLVHDFEGFVREHPEPSFPYERIIQHKSLLGSSEEITARLRELRDHHGVDYYGCDFTFGGLEHAKVMRSLELFGNEVMPRLQ